MSDAIKAEAAWAVRGIPDDVRRAVVDRAKTEGRTVGAWVTDALRHALEGEALSEQVADLRRRIEMLERIR
jgi:plasmid stability protein